MKKILLLLVSLLFVSCNPANETLQLTSEEKEWLQAHPIIYYATDPEFAPYEYFDEENNHTGIIADYFVVIEEILDVDIQVLDSDSWTQALEQGKSNQAQFLFMTETAERLEYFEFTDPFLYSPNVLMFNEDYDSTLDLENIEQYTFGVLKDYSSKDYFTIRYPKAHTKDYTTILEGVFALSRGEIDAFIADLGQINYYIDKYNINSIAIYDTIQYEYEFAFAVNRDNLLLVSILDKTLDSMTRETHENITDRWFDSEFKSWLNRDRTRMIFIASIVIGLTAILLVLINIILRRIVKDRTRALRLLNEELEDRVQKRTEKIEAINEELEASMDELMNTQEKLIASEKYAYLGKLVSSVAHEINTPLGTGITSLTYGQKELHKLMSKYSDNALSKHCFEDSTDALEESLNLISISLKRISKITNQFKRLEATLITDEEHVIKLNTYILQVVDDLKVKKLIPKGYTVKVLIEEDIEITCNPTWLYEIVLNMVMNSIHHGGLEEDTILISAHNHNGVTLEFEDHGKGIHKDDLDHIFDPFYKSSPDSIGLGLSIIKNIVVNNLNGHIEVSSMPYDKTIFRVTCPEKKPQ